MPKKKTPIFSDLESITKREKELDQAQDSKASNQYPDAEKSLSFIKNQKYWIRFDDKDFRKFTGRKMSSNDILNLLLKTSRVEFKLSFPVRLIRENEKMKEDLFNMNIFSRLFELAYVNKNIRKDGIVQKREYFVVYNTILGELFVHNLLTQNYDLVDKGLYDLPARVIPTSLI